MRIVKINPQKVENKVIEEAIHIMENGGMVLYPTDTIYGLGVNIFDDNALNKLFKLKNRSRSKPVSICVSKIDDILKVAYMDDKIKNKILDLLPGPYTIILNKKNIISPILTAGGETIGIRIPDSPLCEKLTQKFPITASSANISGLPTLNSIDQILDQLDTSIDLVLDAGTLENSKPSTVIDFTLDPPKILRQGEGYFK